jgi:hypothetical protein
VVRPELLVLDDVGGDQLVAHLEAALAEAPVDQPPDHGLCGGYHVHDPSI